ncbi:MAG TPA: SpoIID/LytB domain-containing protein, partial [Acidimicrobiales bacterium]|nr:SpoIID/LytB domain-containing protein [Acidimicrobiales bacterium]
SGATFKVFAGNTCGGEPWIQIASAAPGPIKLSSAPDAGAYSSVIETCEVGGNKTYRNDIVVYNNGGQRTANSTLMESYLRGVVPAESPSGWGSLGGGAGMNALRAQAVAARSYAGARLGGAFPQICDTDQCQVYRGVAAEVANTNQAIADTAGHVRKLGSAVASTEFSSSTGGQTAGGTFPSVQDDGDAVAQNPNHNWTAQIPVGTIEAKYGVGALQSVNITERTPADGGRRAKTVVVRGASGSVTKTGDQFRIDFGLKSTWFSVVGQPSGGVNGYWVLGDDGGVFTFGKAGYFGSTGGMRLNQPVVGMAATKSGQGYWLVASDGGIFAYGDAKPRFYGSTGGMRLNKPIVGMARTPSGNGYWLVASDGGIFAYGDAKFWGSTGSIKLNQPVVGMAPTSTGKGYWLVASDGGIFAYGDARFHGSTGSMRLARPVIGMAAEADNSGYWLVAADGGIFAFDAPFHGSLPSRRIVATAVGMRPTLTGLGYVIAASNGDVESFGDGPNFGGIQDALPGWRGRAIGLDVSPGS